jgi:hypothetical protein
MSDVKSSGVYYWAILTVFAEIDALAMLLIGWTDDLSR